MADDEVEVGEWFGIEPFSSLEGSIDVLRSNYAISSFSLPIHWPKQGFYMNRFYRTLGG